MKKIKENIFEPKGQIAFGIVTFILTQLLFPIEWGIVSGLIFFITAGVTVTHSVLLSGYLEMLPDKRRWARTIPVMLDMVILTVVAGLYFAAVAYADQEGRQVPNFCFFFLCINAAFAFIGCWIGRQQLMPLLKIGRFTS